MTDDNALIPAPWSMYRPSRRDVLKTAAIGALSAGSAQWMPHVAHADTTVNVGAVLPLSGSLKAYGEQARMGLDLAAAKINADGGILGRNVEITYGDDRGEAKVSKTEAVALVGRKDIVAVVGPITSASRNAMSDTMETSKTPLLYATDYEGGDCNRFLFYFNTVPNQYAAPLLRYMSRHVGKNFYLLGADYVWPRVMFKFSRKVIADSGGRVAGEQFVPLAQAEDYSSIIKQIGESGAKAMLLALPGTIHVAFIEQAKKAGLLDKVTLGTLIDTAVYLDQIRLEADHPIYACVPFVQSDPSPGAREFVSTVRQTYGAKRVVSTFIMTHYDALIALKAGLEKSGEVSREAAAKGIAGVTYQTPTGESQIGANHNHSSLNMYISKTEGGSIRIAESLGIIQPDPECKV